MHLNIPFANNENNENHRNPIEKDEIMKIQEFPKRIMIFMKILEFQQRIMKIMKIIKYHKVTKIMKILESKQRINKKQDLRIPPENYGNHKNHVIPI